MPGQLGLFDEPEPTVRFWHGQEFPPEASLFEGEPFHPRIPDPNQFPAPTATPSTEAPTLPCDQPGFWARQLERMGEMRLLAARSFIEVARRSGIEHEALTPTGTDSNGQRTYDFDAVTRLANLMRGRPESNRPELKTEADWQEAIEGVKLWKLAYKADPLVKDG